jgi:hypothetical protein
MPTDPILEARLDALAKNLGDVNPVSGKGVVWREQYRLEALPDDEVVWNYLATGIRQQVLRSINAVQKVRDELAKDPDEAKLAELWAAYSRLSAESQDIFQECLELLGGLTLRERVQPERSYIYHFADELIGEFARKTSKNRSFVIPAVREALRLTLGRIIRMRYPEWSIWSLPLTAHEYGHVLEVRPRDLLDAVELDRPGWEAAYGAAAGAVRQGWVETQVRTLWADAFAVYAMGPAYVSAVLFLRFNPAGDPGADGPPRDETRLRVLTGILTRMDPAQAFEGPAYGTLPARLQGWAAQVLQRSPPPQPLSAAELDLVDALTGALWNRLHEDFFLARYSDTGWITAKKWVGQLREQLDGGQPLELQAESTGTLRDALNAGWAARLEHPAHTDGIARAIRNLCDAILNRGAPGGGGGRGREPQPQPDSPSKGG